MNNRRDFLTKMALATGSLSLPSVFSRVNAGQSTQGSDTDMALLPYLQNLCPTEVTICFFTPVKSLAFVAFGVNNTDQIAYGINQGLIDAGKDFFKIKIQNLKPGVRYSYRVITKEIVDFQPYKVSYGASYESAIYSFTTPLTQKNSVSCIVFNDIHDRPESFPLLYNLDNGQPFDFSFLNGDMFNHQDNAEQIKNHLTDPLSKLFASQTPFILSRGNHETRGSFARNLIDYFSYRDNPYYFAFMEGPVYWIVLDTGEDKFDTDKEYFGLVSFDEYREAQARWLKQIIASNIFKKAKYKVVFMHIPPYYSGDWHGTMHCRSLFVPIFNQAKIDLVVSGHTHTYGIHEATDEHHFPIVIGGGPQDGKRTLIRIDADSKNLTLNMLNDKGVNVGTKTISAVK